MRSAAMRLGCALAVMLAVMIPGRAQEPRSGPAAPAPANAGRSTDPRVGLKPGMRDAGKAARHLELVATLPKPGGFFDPKAPAGEATEAERNTPPPADPDAELLKPEPAPARGQRGGSQLSLVNSDMAFKGEHLFVGNFNGFNVYDIEDARKIKLATSVVCPGGQGDVSVHGNLLIMSVEQTRGRIDCGTEGVEAAVSKERFRGVRIFDITDVRKPKQLAAVQTCRGSHTHTLVTAPGDTANLYVYGSGTSTVRSADELAGCSGKNPKEDPNTSLYSIDVIKIPLAAPEQAAIVNRPRIFSDPATGAIAGLWPGGNQGPGTQTSRLTSQCHDITVFPAKGLAAGACAGNGILLDISDPVHPVRLDAVTDKSFAYWHSATFNNDGTKIVFTDEWGGGTRPRCRATDPPTWGADAIFDIVDRKLKFGSYYKMPAPQTEEENCVAHNGSIVPVPGRDIMAQAWYQGGVSIFDFTDSTRPIEIAYFDRGPIDGRQLITAGYWSIYWYNGHLYGSEMARGVDVFRLTPSEFLTQHEIDAAAAVHQTEFNAQQQKQIEWPATTLVARAYLDQLTRTKAIPADRARAVTAAMDRAGRLRSAKDKGAAEAVAQIDTLAGQLESDAAAATGQDAARLRALAATLKGRAAALR